MNSSAPSNSSHVQDDTISISAGSMWFTAFTVTVIYLPFLYKKIRCKFPITVNCWFCNKNTKVPYDDANCWDCPHCEQYNGFNKDGGYNKEIKEQHFHTPNTLVYNTLVQPSSKVSPGKEKIASNGFCKLCNINQQLKIKQLASFVPLNEDNYDEEVEKFRCQLEKSYRLCFQCERTLMETLQNQQYNLFKERLNDQKDKSHLSKQNHYDYQLILFTLQGGLCSFLKLISGIISFTMFISFSTQMEKELNILKGTLPEIFVLDFELFLEGFTYYLTYPYSVKREIISIGLLCYALSSFGRQTRYDHPGLLIFWGILYALSWTDMTCLQMLVSAVCVLLSAMEIRMSPKYTLKRLLRKEPEKMSSEITTEASPDPFDGISSFTSLKRNEVKPDLNESEEIIKESRVLEYCAKAPKKESPKIKPPTPPRIEPQMPQLRNRKVFNKNFLASLESERIEKELSPPPEIFHNLNNLHIGNSCISPEKHSNFLFENHNFEDKFKKTSPLIKPPKFIKTSSSSWAPGELNETISRSSTPSSGYSSQKPDKPETRQNVLFSKVISPISYGRTTPPDNFDYWDRSHPYFSSSNIHYCTPGYLPFQQFPNPIGPATMYTYTRPANFPLSSFTPSANPQSYPFAADTRSSRFSDASETQNLFQNVSQTLQSNQKWATIKSVLYNVSIFLNIVTTCVLGYFTWTGIISLAGN